MSAAEQRQGPADALVAERLGGKLVDRSHVDVELPNGWLLQVKAALRWRSSGTEPNGDPKRQRGQFRLWTRELEYLREHGGAYLLVVYDCEPVDELDGWADVHAWTWASPAWVADHATGWHHAHRSGKGQSALVTWTELVEVET